MKRGKIALTAVLALMGATPLFAAGGVNPANPGLPRATANGTQYDRNIASSMCVDCHTANPGGDTAGTHFVVHKAGSAAVRVTRNTAVEKLGPSAAGVGGVFYSVSKYGAPNGANLPVANQVISSLSAKNLPTAASTTTAGEMLCESCHNLITNVNGGNNLLVAYGKTDIDTSCKNCHNKDGNHHRMTGDQVTIPHPPAYGAPHVLDNTHKGTPKAGSNIAYPASSTGMSCAACHAPHSGALGSAARILKRGASRSDSVCPGSPVNLIIPPDPTKCGQDLNLKIWEPAYAIKGITRQFDVDPAVPPVSKLVSNSQPLCDACHVP